MAGIIKDPLALEKHMDNETEFKKLSYWDQMDAIVAQQARPDPMTAIAFVLGLITALFNIGVVYLLMSYGQMLDGAGREAEYYGVLCKTAIAWCSTSAFLGMDGMYANPVLGYSGIMRSWQVGTAKEPFFCGVQNTPWSFLPKMDFRRNLFDGPILSLAYVISRLWVACSPIPSPAAAWAYFTVTILLLVFNYSTYLGSSGMYHGPFSAFIFLKYTNTPGALSVLQLILSLLYIGCGVGKMGPWFVQVFNQEWTLPAWAMLIDLKPYLYKDMPKDNTPTVLAKVAAFGAAASEAMAGILVCLPSSVVAGTFLELELEQHPDFAGYGGNGSCSLFVAMGIFIIVSMHIYILMHLPATDVWTLNLLPMYLVYYAFYIAPTNESGFDYAGFASLPILWQYASYAFILFIVFGHVNTDKVSYLNCYRFWAGNWPHAYFCISKSGIAKIKKKMAKQWQAEEPGNIPIFAGDKWKVQSIRYIFFGIFFTGQLNHRVLPKLLPKVIKGKSLTEYHDDGNQFYHGFQIVQWLMGLSSNCSLRAFHAIAVLHEICNFETGECVLINVYSFGSHQALDFKGTSTTEWQIIDAKDGVVEKGNCSINECMSYTRPSACRGKDE